ncbi:hypothetical protein NYE24_11420 [Paenibacillus sp. FSL H7-0350]|uniref:hypothetical protein n=1 Tax=Paenibacillus sp. FSL H7-0350 TaxID=2975345 RepID=UPI0031584188
MLKKAYEFFLFYNKIIFREGLGNYAWSLIMPLLIFVSIKINWFFEKPSFNEAIVFFSAIWSYNIVNTYLFGFAGRISIFRENGFLRSFTYVAGDKKPIILSLFFTQILHGLITIIISTSVSAVLFNIDIFKLLFISVLSFFIVSVPISMLMLVLVSLPITTATLNSVGSIIMLPALFITMFRDGGGNEIVNALFLISPVEYVSLVCRALTDMVIYGNTRADISLLLWISLIYIILGAFFWRFIKISSKTVRT